MTVKVPNLKGYRPEIDGLRAVAVLLVIFFHYQFSIFGGGYVGVDVFFVISGYLITRLIKDQVEGGNFSITSFYVRRMRRLFPALFFTLIITTLAAFLLFSAEHLERYGQSLIYALISVSNFFFWQEAGYFDLNAIVKPLLHTWSLSVEEQFYLIWPGLLLLLFYPKKSSLALLGLAIVAVGSLYLSESFLSSDPKAAFFLMPLRAFEFCIGGG